MSIPANFLIPLARVDHAEKWKNGIPEGLKRSIAAAFSATTVDDLAYALGRTRTPNKPILVWGPDGGTPIILMGEGVTEASELQDMAQEALAEQAEMVKKTGRGLDFNELREKNHLPRAEDVGRLMQEAVDDLKTRYKRNQRTIKPRKKSYA